MAWIFWIVGIVGKVGIVGIAGIAGISLLTMGLAIKNLDRLTFNHLTKQKKVSYSRKILINSKM